MLLVLLVVAARLHKRHAFHFLGVENTLFTEGNFNNHLRVPLTLLGMDNEIHNMQSEAGINQVGEMSTLRDNINPNLAIVTNIGSSHLEGLISEQIIAREKSMLMGATKLGIGNIP